MRALALVSVVVCALVTSAPSHAAPAASVAAPAASLKHIRPRDPDAARFLRFGSERSTRFREIVRQLERSNVIVYVDVRMESTHPVGGGLTFVGAAGGYRWVRAVVDSGTGNRVRSYQDIFRLTAILAHELRHAVEASEAPTLTNVREFGRYFRQIGVDEPNVLDTLAARETGAWVEGELRGLPRAIVSSRGND
jgi:hypothetical protein